MPLTNPNNAVTAQRLSEFYQEILPYLNGPEPNYKVYGIRILRDESVPSAKVEYLEDAIGMTPAHMDYENDIFDYGSWGDAFFMPKPCMLKYDGTVDYYLDPNDYSKKEDGTASDIADTSYGGNAMMEWPKIWLKIVPDATKDNKEADIFISDVQVDENYTDWPYHNSLGESVEHFYTAIYDGALISNTLRSISGQRIYQNNTASNEKTYAEANNPSGSYIWTMQTISDIDLITFLIILIGKSTDTQSVFGKGTSNNITSSNVSNFVTGINDTKGLFYGTNSDTVSSYANTIKIFGMENWWGLTWRRYLGEVSVSGVRKRKLTYGTEDGSTVEGYNITGNNYINSGVDAISGGSGGYIKDIVFTELGMFPVISSDASDSTYFCDVVGYNNSSTTIPLYGGGAESQKTKCGAFIKTYSQGSTITYWYYGATISARPLS